MKTDAIQKAARPFVKWAGGKARLLPQLLPLVPPQFTDYYEPFLGGGAFYFGMPHVKQAFLNDINQHLIAAYIHLRDELETVIASLQELQAVFYSLDKSVQKAYYLDRRTEYNKLPGGSIRKTALLIFLNKTSFNGLYRENRQGHFNVPFNQSSKPPILDEANLRLVSQKIAHVSFSVGSYDAVTANANQGDFIYFDPPYYPLNATSSFTGYHANDFGAADQKKLRAIFAILDQRGCFVMLSNSASDFIKELYQGYHQTEILAARSINSIGSSRGKVTELVIRNYI